MSMPRVISPWCISQIATTTAAPTMNMNAGDQNASDRTMASMSTTPEAIALGRSRPARLAFFSPLPGVFSGCAGAAEVSVMASGSDLEQFGFLVLEHVVDLVGVPLGRGVELLLGTGHVVLADLAVLLELLERLLGVAPDVAYGDA